MQQNTQPAAKQPAVVKVSGMPCPGCRAFIPIDIQQLLYEGGITCPHCSLALTIDRAQSKSAMDALQKVETAIKKVKETEKFNR